MLFGPLLPLLHVIRNGNVLEAPLSLGPHISIGRLLNRRRVSSVGNIFDSGDSLSTSVVLVCYTLHHVPAGRI